MKVQNPNRDDYKKTEDDLILMENMEKEKNSELGVREKEDP